MGWRSLDLKQVLIGKNPEPVFRDTSCVFRRGPPSTRNLRQSYELPMPLQVAALPPQSPARVRCRDRTTLM